MSASFARLFLPLLSLFLFLVPSSATADEAEIARLTAVIASGEAAPVATAIDQLARHGAAARGSVPTLIASLEHEAPEVRWRAARALGAMGLDARAAIPALRRALRDKTPRVSAYAAYGLGTMGEAAQDAAVDIVPLVVHQDLVVRRAARDALRKIRASKEITLPLMIQALEGANPEDVVSALRTFSELGEEGLPFLEAALKNPRAAYWACLVVADLGPKAKSLVPLVAAVLDHEDPECRLQAAVALGEIGPEARPAETAVVGALEEDPFAGVQAAAAYALVKMGAKSDEALAAVARARTSEDELLRVVSAWATIQLAPTDPKRVQNSLETMFMGLRSENPQVRLTAARGLIELKTARGVVQPGTIAPHLIAALEDADQELTVQILAGVASLGADIVPAVLEAMKKPELRRQSTLILNRIGPDAHQAVPTLEAFLAQPDLEPELRREIQFALGGIGPAAAPAVPRMMASLESDRQELRRSAAYALGRIGPDARDALPLLSKMTESDDHFDRIAAVWATIKIDLENPEVARTAIPLLTRALEHEREMVRYEAVQALGEIGQGARAAVPALRQRLEDPSALVREAAEDALEKIGA